jgi:hypothetical protein
MNHYFHLHYHPSMFLLPHLKQRLLRLLSLSQQQWRHHGLRGRSSPSRITRSSSQHIYPALPTPYAPRFALFEGESAYFVEFDTWIDLPWFQGEYGPLHYETMCFACYPLKFGIWYLASIWLRLKGSSCFILYIVYFAFLLYFLHTHLSHFASPVILACIYLIMLITVLG